MKSTLFRANLYMPEIKGERQRSTQGGGTGETEQGILIGV